MGRIALDLTGQKFGYLTVLERAGTSANRRALWCCVCRCGTSVVLQSQSLRSQHRSGVKSCGCAHGVNVSSGRGRDGHMMTGSRPWVIWSDLKRRCRNPKDKDFKNYGGRGIDMPDRWYLHFLDFWEDVQDGYEECLQLDRIDVNKSYSIENIRWTTSKVNGRNKRESIIIQTKWGRIPLAEAAEKSGLLYITVYKRWSRGDSGDFLLRPP